MDFRRDFDLGTDTVWLNASHQGALPKVAGPDGRGAIGWKERPYEMTSERFAGVPERLRKALAKLIGGRPEDVVLTNGASYGVHLLANGLPLERGDEVLLMKGDFPSNLLPWLALADRGVRVRVLEPRGEVLDADEVDAHLSPRTRVVCVSWVHSFSGHTLDLEAVGRSCRANGTWLVVNSTQGLGVRPLDVTRVPVDALVNAGWKWLCGPYGTGFAWMVPELVAELRYNQAYWLSAQTADDLGKASRDVTFPEDLGARRYDLFATANFFNFKPFAAAVEYLAERGVESVHRYVEVLVQRLIDGLAGTGLHLASLPEGRLRSSLVFLSHEDPGRNAELYQRLRQAGIEIALRRSRLRVSPHLYNLEEEIDRVLAVLREAG